MNPRRRIALLAAIAAVVLVGATLYGVLQWQRMQQPPSVASTVAVATGPELEGARIVFRNTASGEGYGHVAAVPLNNPGAPRSVGDMVCDRVDATSAATICLRTKRGIVTTFEAELYTDQALARSWPLAGIPSRTRLSSDGELVATTSFVTGHSYAAVGFSTETVVTDASGASHGNLEEFTLSVDGAPLFAIDRNLWGVTFADDGNTFYATAASGGRTWLVEGDLERRTLTAVREGAECPSLSPDGTRVAYKKNVGTGSEARWSIAVYDFATGEETLLPVETVDDQVEWLDDDTLLFGLARADTPGDSDIWAVTADGGSEPRLLIEHAWSPAVIP
ncbi:hypothetical protein [Diaminobutyricimonas sp. LJ205]|uniref:hypothetical protein n=1 Tax=Diaminobutyricimonas sp. LJ205 TaxID=2683590 RepID=UPI0012F50D05|nr:hypothetical protein [Diaminobutyricimonas sp. LJ205]